MEKVLIVVDMQNDFIDGALGTVEAVKISGRTRWKKSKILTVKFIVRWIRIRRIIYKRARADICRWCTVCAKQTAGS